MTTSYLEVTQNAGRLFLERQVKGPVTMLNMLRFLEFADYSASPELAPESPISGAEAYKAYMEAVGPLLAKAGGELTFFGQGGHFLIGPEDMRWDTVLLVKHASVEKFMAFATDESYLKIAGHRAAALSDSRLLPLV